MKAALVRDVCVSQITASFKLVISSVCRRYVHGHLSSQPYGVLEKIMLILCVFGLQESFFSVFTTWVPYVDGKMSLKQGKSISYRFIFIASVRNSFFVFVGYGDEDCSSTE